MRHTLGALSTAYVRVIAPRLVPYPVWSKPLYIYLNVCVIDKMLIKITTIFLHFLNVFHDFSTVDIVKWCYNELLQLVVSHVATPAQTFALQCWTQSDALTSYGPRFGKSRSMMVSVKQPIIFRLDSVQFPRNTAYETCL